MVVRRTPRMKGIVKLAPPIVEHLVPGDSYFLEGNVVHKFVAKRPTVTVVVRKGSAPDNVEMRRVPPKFLISSGDNHGVPVLNVPGPSETVMDHTLHHPKFAQAVSVNGTLSAVETETTNRMKSSAHIS